MRHPAYLPAPRATAPSVRALLMMSVAVVGLSAGVATAAPGERDPNHIFANPEVGAKPKPVVAPVPDDGLGTRDVYVEADDMMDDRPNNTVTATGHVEIRYQTKTLRADKVIYNSLNGAVHASGHVVVISPDGSVEYADDAILDDQLRAGVALGFSARLQDNVSIVAHAAIRRAETVNELRSARYTACNICNKDGSPKNPSFSIEADRIIEDRDRQVIYYRHAVIRVLGVPVLYLPIFWHPDPTATRRSGFLTPKIEYSKRRGATYEQPYLWAISPYGDLTLTPQINTRVNPLLNIHYRERFFSGELDVRAGYTYEQLFDNHSKFGNDTSRSYILAKGAFDLDPKWTVGFGLERVTDPTFFRRYGVHRVFQDRGPFSTDTDRLISQIYAKRQDRETFFSIAALSFQSLRAAVVTPTTGPSSIQPFDNSSAFPVAVPLEARYDPGQPILGGRVRFQGSAVSLTRNNSVVSITDTTGLFPAGPEPIVAPPISPAGTVPSYLVYRDSRRVSGGVDWRRTFTLANGIRVSPFAEVHGDAYSLNGARVSTGINNSLLKTANSTVGRGSGTAGADISWPFIKPVGNGSIILEPIAQIAISPRIRSNANIPNEDSASFEFDETTLFTTHRFTGHDLDEGGQRINVGGRATADWGKGRSGSLLIGRVFSTQINPVFSAPSGLQKASSDWVTAATLTPLAGLSFFNRARLDGDTWKVRREEAGVNASFGPVRASARYLYDENGLVQVECQTTIALPTCLSPFGGRAANGSTVIGKVQNAELSGAVFLSKHWGVTANVTRDLQTNIWPVAQMGVFYQDECSRLDLIYTHDETFAATIGSSDSIVLRLTLATLGASVSPGQKPNDSR